MSLSIYVYTYESIYTYDIHKYNRMIADFCIAYLGHTSGRISAISLLVVTHFGMQLVSLPTEVGIRFSPAALTKVSSCDDQIQLLPCPHTNVSDLSLSPLPSTLLRFHNYNVFASSSCVYIYIYIYIHASGSSLVVIHKWLLHGPRTNPSASRCFTAYLCLCSLFVV